MKVKEILPIFIIPVQKKKCSNKDTEKREKRMNLTEQTMPVHSMPASIEQNFQPKLPKKKN